ncbi:hypothetical protein Tco_1457626 [Tanacetum coccineum]
MPALPPPLTFHTFDHKDDIPDSPEDSRMEEESNASRGGLAHSIGLVRRLVLGQRQTIEIIGRYKRPISKATIQTTLQLQSTLIQTHSSVHELAFRLQRG